MSINTQINTQCVDFKLISFDNHKLTIVVENNAGATDIKPDNTP